MADLEPGLVWETTLIVEDKHTADFVGSGGVHVLATPIMVALMEDAARSMVDPLLGPDRISVGTGVDVKHQAATPVGMRVTARAELIAVNGRTLTFHVEAHDEHESVGHGTHTRAIVNRGSFLSRLQLKAGSSPSEERSLPAA